jgi:hypothetical protein
VPSPSGKSSIGSSPFPRMNRDVIRGLWRRNCSPVTRFFPSEVAWNKQRSPIATVWLGASGRTVPTTHGRSRRTSRPGPRGFGSRVTWRSGGSGTTRMTGGGSAQFSWNHCSIARARSLHGSGRQCTLAPEAARRSIRSGPRPRRFHRLPAGRTNRPLTKVVAIRSSEKGQLGSSEKNNKVRPASVGVAGS